MDCSFFISRASTPTYIRPDDYVPKSNEERLLLFAGKGDVEGVKRMLDAGVDIETRDNFGIAKLFRGSIANSGKTPLHIACMQKEAAVVQCLLERAKKEGRVIVYAIATIDRPPLTDAISRNALACIDLLLQFGTDIQSFPPTVRYINGYHFLDRNIEMNPLIYAIFNRRVAAVEKMLNSIGKEGVEPAFKQHLLPLVECSEKIVAIVGSYCLGSSGEYLNNPENFNLSPLKLAKKMIKEVENTNAQAAIFSEEIVELLIQAGAVDETQEPPRKKQRIS